MYSFNTGLCWIVDHGIGDPARFQHFKSCVSFFSERIKLTEFDRLRWTCFGARRLQARALPVRAEGTLECPAIGLILFPYAKGTAHNKIRTAVADIRLYVNCAKLHAHDCACRACFQAARHFAMLADVRREAPRR